MMRVPFETLCQVVMLCVFLCACADEDGAIPPPKGKQLPNIVLISIDTLRADHLSLYGYERETSPFLEEFAEEADVYTRCMATSPWTLPTHASMFTGLFPFEHGARRHLGEKPTVIYPPLPDELPLLPEILQDAGYKTLAYSANQAVIIPRHGFDRGFDHFRSQWMHADTLNFYVMRGFELFIEEDEPFFLFVNYMDTHVPYNTRPIPGFMELEISPDSVELQQALFKLVVGQADDVPQEKLDLLRDKYDLGIRHVDAAIQELLETLDDMGHCENTLFIITSDHGELFGEHDMVGHVYELYQGVLHVPLLVKAPGQTEGHVLDEVVSSADLPGMILDAVSPELAEQHKESFPYRVGNHLIIAECYYGSAEDIYGAPWAERFMKTQTAMWEWPWKLITDSKGGHLLFNLDNDPQEQHNLAGKNPVRIADMLKRLRDWQDTRPRYTPDLEQNLEISDEDREALENLGYL